MEKQLLVCIHHRSLTGKSPSCGGRGADAIVRALETLITQQGLALKIGRIECLGHCAEGPNLRLSPGGKLYNRVTLEQLPAIVSDISKLADVGETRQK